MDTGAQDTWRRTYGGYGVDECRTVIHTMDGGFLFGGSTGSFETDGDMYVVKTDASGVVQWSLPFGGLGVQNSVAVVESDPDFFLAGMTALGGHGGYDFTLTALGHTGSILWVSDIGTPDWDLCADMDRMEEGFILVGTTYHGDPAGDVWVVRTDEVGDTVWTRRLGGAGLDEAFGVNVDGSGHILVAGRLDGDSDDEDGFLARLTSNGEVDWLERFGGDSADVAFDVVESEDGAYVLVGATNSYATVPQVLVRKMDQLSRRMGPMSSWEPRIVMQRCHKSSCVRWIKPEVWSGKGSMVRWVRPGCVVSSNGRMVMRWLGSIRCPTQAGRICS